MSYLGSWKIDDQLCILATCHRFTSGAAYAPTVITYTIYEDDNTSHLVENVDMVPAAPFDGIVGLYLSKIQLTTVMGFEKGKNYLVVIKATVDGVGAIATHTFQIEAEVDANAVSPTVSANVISQDNIDFGVLQKLSLNAATPASVQNVAANGSGFTSLGDTRIANLDATVSSRTKPADTQAAVTTVATTTNLTNAPTAGDLTDTMKTSVGTAVASQLNTAIPGNPTADSVNERIKAVDDLTQASGAGDLAAAVTARTTILARLGAWTGTGINTILGALRGLCAKAAALTPTDISTTTTYDNTTDSAEAIRDAVTGLTGVVVVASNAPVLTSTDVVLYSGNDYCDTRALLWTVTNYTGPSLSGATGKLRLLPRSTYQAGATMVAALEVTATITQVSTTVSISVTLTAANTTALTAVPASEEENYRYQVIATTAGSKIIGLVDGDCVVRRTIAAIPV